MKTEAYWEGDKLFFRTRTGKVRHIANYDHGIGIKLETFHNGSTYYVGTGKSLALGVEVETYWSRAEGATYLIHFDPVTGDTMVQPDKKNHYICQWKRK